MLVLVASAAHAQPAPRWEVRVPARVELTVGEPGALPIALAVDRGLTVSRDGSVIVDLQPPNGLTVKKRRLERRDAVDPEADAPRFVATLTAAAAGEQMLPIRLRFWVCGARVCRPIDVRRTVAIAARHRQP